MAENDLTHHGPDAEDPDQVHAPLSRAVADFLPADALTRTRHLRVAINAFNEESSIEESSIEDDPTGVSGDDETPEWSAHTPSRRLRLYRTLGAVAAAALGIVGFGVVQPLLSSPRGEDTGIMASELSSVSSTDSSGVPLTPLSNDSATEMSSESMLRSADAAQSLFNLTGLCDSEIEVLIYEFGVTENSGFSWVAYAAVDDGFSVIFVKSTSELSSLEEAQQAATRATEIPAVILVLEPISCALLRIERAGP
jgi:hypothetical protein